jgi:hypothetical protein
MREVPDPTCVTVEVEVALPLGEARRRAVEAMLSGAPISVVHDDKDRRLTAVAGVWYEQQEYVVVELSPLPDGTLLRITSQDHNGPTHEFLRRNVENVSGIAARLPTRSTKLVPPRRHAPPVLTWEVVVALGLILGVLALVFVT